MNRDRLEVTLEVALGNAMTGDMIGTARYLGAALEHTDESNSVTNPDLTLRACVIRALWHLQNGRLEAAEDEIRVAMSEVPRPGISPLLREQDMLRLERWSSR